MEQQSGDLRSNLGGVADPRRAVETQTFTYDALDRLVTAGATGTSQQGGYATETYGYEATTGNLTSKAGVTYTYNSGHAHAVSSLSNGNSYVYDANGNMTTRNADGKSYTFAYDAENRLVSVSGDATAAFTFNGDGQRVKSVMDGETTLFVGGHYEITNPGAGQTVTKYYMAGATRVAVRKGATLSYLLVDHLGSTSLSTDSAGNRTSELRYKPWGETRFSFGTMPTKYTFTGQFSYTDDPSTPESEGFGLMYYNARWMEPSIGRFTQPDSVIPETSQGTQAWDRYAYTNNNPVLYSDPTGHNVFSTLLSIGATICDITALAVSVAGATLEVVAALGGEALTPIPGVDGAVGFTAAVGAYNLTLNPLENTLSAASWVMTVASDVVSGQTHIEQSGETTKFLVGPDTTFNTASMMVGNTFLTPDAITDSIANIATVYYDVSSLAGGEPFWGKFQVGAEYDGNGNLYPILEAVPPPDEEIIEE